MLNTKMGRLFTLLLLLGLSFSARAQVGLCPPNLDFENGNFFGWECRYGITDNGLPLPGVGPVDGRHTIISEATAGTDIYGGFPELCPNGSGYSVKLGNNGTGKQMESLSYTYTIPSTLTIFSMIFHYAVVIQDPISNHTEPQKPRFRARITDLSTNSSIPCVDFDFTADSAPGGFQLSPLGTPQVPIYYKNWTPITVNLNAYIGRTIKLEFITNDCTQGAHFGYAYVDVNTNCNGAIAGTNICQGESSINLSAPFGFASYEWYGDPSFGTVVATTQSLYMNPAPSVGTVMPVVVTPFTGFGCKDTLYATIGVSPKPVSDAGPDAVVCENRPAQLGVPNNDPILTFSWSPAGDVSNPLIPNPTAIISGPGPVEFIVTTTDILTGCFSYDTTYVTTQAVDNTASLTGANAFCDLGSPVATLSVSSLNTSVQWYSNPTTPIPGATQLTYQPMVTGDYWAQIVQGGCTDSTNLISVYVHPQPTAGFSTINTQCETDNLFKFTNISSTPADGPLAYTWRFSDGGTSTLFEPEKSFPGPGTYRVQLEAKTTFGCTATTAWIDLFVRPNGEPDFKWDSVCTDRPVTFTNLSDENGSTFTQYQWEFDDGGPGSTASNPPPVIYVSSGSKNVKLIMTTAGCEDKPVEIVKAIQVNGADESQRYKTITVPEGSTRMLKARDDMGKFYNWLPQTQLTAYDKPNPEFIAVGNDIEYHIEITDEHTCVTVDTMLVQILKKPGYYLPTAFTPNGDGLNDIVRPYLVRMKNLKSFSIYNRWGNLVFRTFTEGEGWDGTYQGNKQQNGVYVWILEFKNADDQIVTEKGTITLIR